MSVYVDNGSYEFGIGARKMILSHMIADTQDELIDMAEQIGVDTKWIQKPGTKYEHFDIAQTKRKLAITLGAIRITSKELAAKLKARDLNAYQRPSPWYENVDNQTPTY